MKELPIVRPPFFDCFRCVGAECRVSCCTGFRFPLRDHEVAGLAPSLWTQDERGYCFRVRANGDCPCWSADHRCSLQRGEDQRALPGVCRVFPRIVTPYPDRIELGLDVLCPEVFRLLAGWELGELVVDGDAELTDELFVRRAALMAQWRTQPLPGVPAPFEGYLRRLGAYLLYVHYPVYLEMPKARGIVEPIRRFVEGLVPRLGRFAEPNWDFFDFLCREWRLYSPEFGFDVEIEGCFKSIDELLAEGER